MEENFIRKSCEEEEEYVFLDLDAVAGLVDLPPNAPYVLSGLDTLNPILTIDDKWKLVGEYEETIGTCLVFSENDAAPVVHEETGPSDANLFTGACIMDPNLPPVKQVTPIARLQKILKFRLLEEDDVQDANTEHPNSSVSMDTPPAKADVRSQQ
ncbi:general transcription factor 3C polypeptide 6-like isoform X2 [Tripterygium wilfordii]|nr:general transcription factor 3C polypeptide 6-like isoform X2 [Tripterygium wilfordii]XP_038678888.1 general transcription factor 3C polypeptide 6-like isoform X2 [Tripterygium wilfordii]